MGATEESLTMPTSVESLKPNNLGWGKFTLCVIGFLSIVIYVAATLLWGYVFDLKIVAVGVTMPMLIYAVAIAFLAYKIQQWLSQAYGGRRVIETFVSGSMLVPVVLAFAIWIKFPLLGPLISAVPRWVGHPLDVLPTDYKLGVAVIFGLPSFIDVFFRDILGIGRSSSQRMGSFTHSPNGTASSNHEPQPLPSRTGVAEYATEMPVDIHPVFRFVMPDGTRVLMNPTQRIAARVIDQQGRPDSEGGDNAGTRT
jgi:hypothetical protein